MLINKTQEEGTQMGGGAPKFVTRVRGCSDFSHACIYIQHTHRHTHKHTHTHRHIRNTHIPYTHTYHTHIHIQQVHLS